MVKEVLKLKKIKIKNNQDVDIVIRDAFGKEYLLFPKEERKLAVLEKEKKNDRR